MVSRAIKGSHSTMAQSCTQAKTWVKTHYECHEDGVVAKAVMYKHYEDYCRDLGRNIMETSIFGRVVKSVFQDVMIRRLGGRDNLKYCYCGIRAKESSPYASDNATTTRPKRRLRKRELGTDNAEVENCLRWLRANYIAGNDVSVVKTDVYEGYVAFCRPRKVEPLSIQYFGMVITHAFPHVTKRKLGPRTNQQKYYFGIQLRPNPILVDSLSPEYLNSVDVLTETRSTYRENLDNAEDEEEDENCRSPASDMSDMIPSHNALCYDTEIRTSPQLQHYEFGRPVDYSLKGLQLKDEDMDEDFIVETKNTPLDLHVARTCEGHSPDRSASVTAFVSSASPSPPGNPASPQPTRQIYKPRFHYNSAPPKPSSIVDDAALNFLRIWITKNVNASKGFYVNRDQIYNLYEEKCNSMHMIVQPMSCFDEIMLKTFDDVFTQYNVLTIHSTKKTFYEGIRIYSTSELRGKVEELMMMANEEDYTSQNMIENEDENSQNAMELSPVDGSTSHSSPFTLDEEEMGKEEFSLPTTQSEDQILQPTAEVLRDGRFYLRSWLMDNFHYVPSLCVLKADAYRHYEAYVRSIGQTPFEMNVFGKIVRQVFPNVSIRRLGGRLKPQYHYCGIAVKESSPLYHYMGGKDPAQRSRKKEIATDSRSAEVVIEFLRKNYKFEENQIVMKSEVFEKYCAYCTAIEETPISLNYFGKLVKHCFPNVEVRKYGGRTEPNWYYFNLASKMSENPTHSLRYQMMFATSPTSYQSEGVRDTCRGMLNHLPISSAAVLPPYGPEALHMASRPTSSPIPISVRQSIATLGHLAESPSAHLHTDLQAALRVSSYEDSKSSPVIRVSPNDHVFLNSPSEHASLLHEALGSHSPVENGSLSHFYTQTPSDIHHPINLMGRTVFCQSSSLEGMVTRDTLPTHTSNGIPDQYQGQVVPSQTPPNLGGLPGQTHAIPIMNRPRRSRTFGNHDDSFETTIYER